MNWGLLKRSAAIRMLPRTGLIVLGVASLVTMIRLGLIESGKLGASNDGVIEIVVALAVLWFPAAAFLLYTGALKRCTRLDLVLPISARTLWSHNLTGVIFTAYAMVAVTAGMMGIQEVGIRNWLLGRWDTPGLNVFDLLPQVFGVVAVSAVVIQSLRPERFTIGFDRRFVGAATAVITAGFALSFGMYYLPAAVSLVPAAAGILIAVGVHRRLPEAFDFAPAPADGEAAPKSATAAAYDGKPATGVRRQVIIFQTAWGWWSLAYIPFVVIMGLLLAGLPNALLPEVDTRFANIAIIWYMLLAIFPNVMKKLHALDALPISKRQLFAHLVLPGMIFLVFGYGASEVLMTVKHVEGERIRFWENESHHYLSIPTDKCEISWDGSPRTNTSPAGETHDAWSTWVTKIAPTRIYSPFSTPPGSSIDFVAWQLSRAVEAVYGETIPPKEIADEYLEIDDEGRVVPRGGALTIQTEHPEFRRSGAGGMFPFAFLLAVAPFLLLALVYFRAFRPGAGSARPRWTMFTILAATFGLHVLVNLGGIAKWFNIWSATAFVEILMRHAVDALPGGVPTAWLLCGIVVAAVYKLAERGFERIEIPLPARKPVD
jgi:hypothetical protein